MLQPNKELPWCRFDNMVAMNLLFGGDGTDTPLGLLATMKWHFIRSSKLHRNGCCYCDDNLQPQYE